MKTTPQLLSLTLIFLHAVSFCLGQEVFSTFGITMNSIMEETKQADAIINPQTGCFNLILSDLKKLSVYDFDSMGKIIHESFAEKPNSDFTELLGGISVNGITTVFLTTISGSEVTASTFGNTGTAIKKIEFLSGKEKLIESFEYNHHFYLLTLQKYSSVLTLYRLDHTGIRNSHVIDLSRYRFANSSRNKLYTVLSDSVYNTNRLMISKVRSDIPNTFDAVLNGGKLYIDKGMMILTLDNSTKYTILISVNLDNFTCKLNSYPQLNTSCNDQFSRSNSFLYHGNLYQVKFCDQEIHFQVYDTCTKQVIKSHLVNPENFDIFRNTIISRVGTGKEGITLNKISVRPASKDLDSARIAIKKITKGQPGIMAFGQDDQTVVTIGGQSSFEMDIVSPMKNFEAPIGTGVGFRYRPGIKLHLEWANYFRTMLDKNFDHHEGEISTTAIDDLFGFVKSNGKKEIAELVFKWHDAFILGYYDMELQQYSLVKFTE